MARWFEPSTVTADLQAHLACRYAATTEGRHDLIPDGSMDLVWVDGAEMILCGPDTHGWSFEPSLGTDVVGVRFRPGAAAGAFRIDAGELLDRRVALADVIGAGPARRTAERIAAAPDLERRMGVLEDFVRLRIADRQPDGTVALASIVATDPAHGVEGLAARAGLSTRQLRRRFDREVGYGPAFFARIARVQRFARAAARHPDPSLAELATAAGYADQAHLAKDCRAIIDMTPRQVVDAVARSSVVVELRSARPTARRVDRAVA